MPIREKLETSTKWIKGRRNVILLIIVLALGTSLRVYNFPNIPNGLNQDELSAGYESYSLALTGSDRWGNKWPVYFPSWGSGQNVLQSYLSVPAVKVFGLTPLAVRIIPLLLGLLSLPLMYFFVKKIHGPSTALLATFILAVSPWHIVLTRWGLESNLLPFFLLLGMLTLVSSLQKPTAKIVLSLVPFSLGIYAYGISLVTTLPFFLLVWVIYRREVFASIRYWVYAIGAFTIISLPLFLFVIENYVIKHPFSFVKHLPFSIPLLPETRLSQIRNGNTLIHNFHFFLSGLSDHYIWNTPTGILPLPPIVLLGAIIGIAFSVKELLHKQRPNIPFLWLIACVALLFIVPLDINQINSVLLVLVILCSYGFIQLAKTFQSKKLRSAFHILIIFILALYTLQFVGNYFGGQYATASASNFNPGLKEAFVHLEKDSQNTSYIYVTDSISLNYVQTLFYLQINPKLFQASHPDFSNPDFGKFIFSNQRLSKTHGIPYTYLIKAGEAAPCQKALAMYQISAWKIGRCQ